MRDIPEGAAALSSAARMSQADWPGVVAVTASGWRVAVNAKGSRYALQSSFLGPDGVEVWAGRSYASRAKLLAAGVGVDGLAEACEGLPEDPAQAVPALQAARAALLDQFALSDWRLEGYPRTVWREGNLRVIVSPCGTHYRGQFRAFDEGSEGPEMVGHWQCRWSAPSTWLLALRMAAQVLNFRDVRGLSSPETFEACLGHLPENAIDGDWPKMPHRPACVPRDAEGNACGAVWAQDGPSGM